MFVYHEKDWVDPTEVVSTYVHTHDLSVCVSPKGSKSYVHTTSVNRICNNYILE